MVFEHSENIAKHSQEAPQSRLHTHKHVFTVYRAVVFTFSNLCHVLPVDLYITFCESAATYTLKAHFSSHSYSKGRKIVHTERTAEDQG